MEDKISGIISYNMNIIELIREIRKRPAMFITTQSIHTLKAFLDGWIIARNSLSESFQDALEFVKNIESDNLLMNSFQKYIEQKYDVKSSQSWASIILFYSQDEYDALEKFFEEFKNFING